jgi:hypothetical protein
MSQLGHERRFSVEPDTSALRPASDMADAKRASVLRDAHVASWRRSGNAHKMDQGGVGREMRP